MNVKVESVRTIKPFFDNGNIISPHPSTHSIPLSVFDKVTYNAHMAVIYAFRPPTPPTSTIVHGLQRALAEYREWAGRLGHTIKNINSDEDEDEDHDGNDDLVILLNDKGVKLVIATVDINLEKIMPLNPSPTLLTLHPSLKDVEELVQVQLTKFACGSLVVGFTAHHLVADGDSTSRFLVAWGKACRGLDMTPLPTHDRTIFSPEVLPPNSMVDHRGREFKSKKQLMIINKSPNFLDSDIVVHKVHFSLDFIAKVKTKATSPGYGRPYSTFVSVVAHLWRSITKARQMDGSVRTQVRISVNGRSKLAPQVPNEYFGNLVLWAFPSARVMDLLHEELSYAATIIQNAVANVNANYFKSFINFANSNVKKEKLVSTASMNGRSSLCPDLEVDSWLRFPFHDLDFGGGGGGAYAFMPSYFPTEGMMFLLPSSTRDGSIDAFIPLFKSNLETFIQSCYSLDWITS